MKTIIRLGACAAGVATAAVALIAATALASGGGSVAAAPMLAYGQVVAGGGLEQEFWRLPLYSGDRITFLAELGSNPEYGTREYGFTLYSPSVTDYNLRDAGASNEAALSAGKNEFTLTSPFSGVGTLDVCEGLVESSQPCGELAVGIITPLVKQADPYSFTATITHTTSLLISVPTLARRGSIAIVRASVQSPAGAPQGSCLIQGRLVTLTGGKCVKRVRLGLGRRQTIRVSFVPDDGWQAGSGHRTIRLLP